MSTKPKNKAKTPVKPARSNSLPIIGAAVAIVGGLFVVFNRGGGSIEGVEAFANLSREHQSGNLTYPQAPPVGGVHNPSWQNCGIYDTQVPTEYAVHSLEHGAAWIAYQPDLDAAQVEKLRSLVRGRPYTLLAPYAYGPLDTPIAAVAWGVRLKVSSADDPRLPQFLSRHTNGPQTPEPGAVCSGAYGSPIG